MIVAAVFRKKTPFKMFTVGARLRPRVRLVVFKFG